MSPSNASSMKALTLSPTSPTLTHRSPSSKFARHLPQSSFIATEYTENFVKLAVRQNSHKLGLLYTMNDHTHEEDLDRPLDSAGANNNNNNNDDVNGHILKGVLEEEFEAAASGDPASHLPHHHLPLIGGHSGKLHHSTRTNSHSSLLDGDTAYQQDSSLNSHLINTNYNFGISDHSEKVAPTANNSFKHPHNTSNSGSFKHNVNIAAAGSGFGLVDGGSEKTVGNWN
eukprot:gene29911-37041_t